MTRGRFDCGPVTVLVLVHHLKTDLPKCPQFGDHDEREYTILQLIHDTDMQPHLRNIFSDNMT